jgi:Tol biopolymer transport system component
MQNKRIPWEIFALIIALMVLFFGDNIWQQMFDTPFFRLISNKPTSQGTQVVEAQPTSNPWAGIVDINPQGMEIISSYDLWFASLAGNRWQVWHLDGASREIKRIQFDAQPEFQLLDEFVPALSPDRKQIAFAAGPCAENGACNRDLFLANVDGTNVRQITNTCKDEFHPTWSPDGQHITYFSGSWQNPDCPQTPHGIWVMDMKTNQHRQLTDQVDYNPSWSPDGKYIAFNSITPSPVIKVLDFSTCTGSINGCETWIVANTDGLVDSPGWINNKTLIFSSNYEGNWDIYQVPFLPGQILAPQRIVSNAWDDQYPAVSSDGKILIWQSFPYYKDGGDSGQATSKAAVIYVMELPNGKSTELITGIGNSRDGFLIRK